MKQSNKFNDLKPQSKKNYLLHGPQETYPKKSNWAVKHSGVFSDIYIMDNKAEIEFNENFENIYTKEHIKYYQGHPAFTKLLKTYDITLEEYLKIPFKQDLPENLQNEYNFNFKIKNILLENEDKILTNPEDEEKINNNMSEHLYNLFYIKYVAKDELQTEEFINDMADITMD